jgi:phosphatidylserine decarboxylase
VALTKFGTDVLLTVAVIAVILVALAMWTDVWWLSGLLIAIAVFIVAFSLNFFRDPERAHGKPESELDRLVLCPADGKVVIIKDAREEEYLKSDAKMISIFMSPMNVHVNRSPMTGVVEFFRYVKGEFLVAHAEEASHRNERAIIGLNSNGYRILFTQVAGYIARRIVCPVKVGDNLKVGERYGMIKFGSRVDIFLPKESKVLVKVGEITVAGETIMAELPEQKNSA